MTTLYPYSLDEFTIQKALYIELTDEYKSNQIP
jgi:hypothetical protein